MLTKEELKGKYLLYSEDITEEVFNKIIQRLNSLGIYQYASSNSYLDFRRYKYLSLYDCDMET